MEIVVVLLIAFILVFVLSILFDHVKVVALSVLSILKLLLSFKLAGFDSLFTIYFLLTVATFLIALGTECFNSYTEGTWIPRPDGGGWAPDDNHPVTGFIMRIILITFLIGAGCLIAKVNNSFAVFIVASGIELLLSIIAFIRVFFS